MATRAVFFDLGGTLMVMRRDRIIREVLLREGRDVGIEQIHAAYMGVESWWLTKYGGRYLSKAQTEGAYAVLNQKIFEELFALEGKQIYEGAMAMWKDLERKIPHELYADSEPVLKALSSRGFALGLISNAPAETAVVVQNLGLGRYLTNVVISGDVGYTKPHPKIFEIALERAGVAPEEAVHVGDLYEADVVGAAYAGMRGVLIDRDGAQSGYQCERIRSLSELEGILA